MNYFILRDDQRYGPYTLADLQRYASSGEVLLTDLAVSDASTEPVPVAQVVGTIAVPPPLMAAPAPYAPTSVYPDPPNLHWALVLVLGAVTCGLFNVVWDIVQAAWIKRLVPRSNALFIYLGGIALLLILFAKSFYNGLYGVRGEYIGLLQFAYYVVVVVARFSFRKSMEDHYNQAEPIGLSLSGAMTFFFGSIYFQYHINEIMRRKHNDRLYALSR